MNLLLFAESATDMCSRLSVVWTIFGYIIFGIKVVVPLLLIISGMITMAKAVMEKKDDKIKDAQKLLVQKVIAAVIVFLVIQVTSIVVNLVADESWKTCAECALHPFSGNGCGLTRESIME